MKILFTLCVGLFLFLLNNTLSQLRVIDVGDTVYYDYPPPPR